MSHTEITTRKAGEWEIKCAVAVTGKWPSCQQESSHFSLLSGRIVFDRVLSSVDLLYASISFLSCPFFLFICSNQSPELFLSSHKLLQSKGQCRPAVRHQLWQRWISWYPHLLPHFLIHMMQQVTGHLNPSESLYRGWRSRISGTISAPTKTQIWICPPSDVLKNALTCGSLFFPDEKWPI